MWKASRNFTLTFFLWAEFYITNLQILTKCQNIHIYGPQISHRFLKLIIGFSKAQHYWSFGYHTLLAMFCMFQNWQALLIPATTLHIWNNYLKLLFIYFLYSCLYISSIFSQICILLLRKCMMCVTIRFSYTLEEAKVDIMTKQLDQHQQCTYPALGSLTILWSRLTVSTLWAKTSKPEWTKVSTAVRSPRKSEVKHSTMISGLRFCTSNTKDNN